MKLTVTKRYVDKNTKEMVYPGTVLKDIPEARGKELLEALVAEAVPEKPREKLKEKTKKDNDNTAPEA